MTIVHETHPRLERRARLFELADSQGGYFTAAQAKALGYLAQYQQHHRKSGAWVSEGRGLYRLRDYPPGEHAQIQALSLWSHDRRQQPQATLSHHSALAFYELSDLMPAKVHLSVPPTFKKAPPPFVVLHRATLAPGDYQDISGFRVTTPLRTLLDVAQEHLSPEHLEAATQQALQRGLLRRGVLQAALETSKLPYGALMVFQRILRQL